jgi:hypothetical protein
MSIASKAMVLNLQIGLWQGYRLDKEASRKVTQDANANQDAARVNKHLVPKDALADVVTAPTPCARTSTPRPCRGRTTATGC